MASDNKTDFLRFSAYSFKDMLTRKMSENSKFTDQVYEGSNLAILIDLCAYLFQCTSYCLNRAAAESMFSDTQLYENISRLVKLIGYNPSGFIPSICEFSFDVDEDYNGIQIPKYSAINTGTTDSSGKDIYYSFADTYELENGTNTVKLYNGIWKLYDTIFTASGHNYETFVLNNLYSDTEGKRFVSYGYIDVYVKRGDSFIKFNGLTDEIFMNASKKYDNDIDAISIYKNTDDDRYYSIRLNEKKQYEIKFGNDNNGQKLRNGDQVYVFYMESNGFDAVFQSGEINGVSLLEPAKLLGLNDHTFYVQMLGANEEDAERIKEAIATITTVVNTSSSTQAQSEEDVDSIRETAPEYYKLGNRLVSKSDFEYYVKNKYKDNIIDTKCHNNWDYVSQFYGWLYKLGKSGVRTQYSTTVTEKRTSNPLYYIDFSKLSKYDYFYADPADQNNVYLWTKMQISKRVTQQELDVCLNPIKILTSEVVIVEPINVNFALCAAPMERALQYIDDGYVFDVNNETYLEVTINDNALYSNASVKTQINSIFNDYFRMTKCRLGQRVSSNEIENLIYSINGVQNIRTVFSSSEVDEYGERIYEDRYVNGISFASWSQELIDAGDDLEVSTVNKSLEEFQFPTLYNQDMTSKIQIVKKSFSNNSTVQY